MDSWDPESDDRPQSRGEEFANSVSHGLGALAALIGLPFLIGHALRSSGGAASVAGAAVFGTTAALLYLASTLYHALPRGRAKKALRVAEHSAIFLLIAGTYTPFTLGVLRGPWGWTLLGLIWALAVGGIVLKSIAGVRYPALSTGLYIAMGWLVIVAIGPLWQRLAHGIFVLVVLGGVAYTAGVAFYALDNRLRYSHFVWHLFVLAGTSFHFFAVLGQS